MKYFRSLCNTTTKQPQFLHTQTASMLVKVKTLTGKEIEIDIDPTDKVILVSTRDMVASSVLT